MSENNNSSSESDPAFDWNPFYEKVRGLGTSETLNLALAHIDRTKRPRKKIWRAVDLGCGEGRDTLDLLNRGWRVLAIDNTHSACTALTAKASELRIDSHLTVRECSFDNAAYGRADLINACLALPYCPPDRFARVWSKILKALQPGGYLSCNLFGDRHDWANLPYVSSFTRDHVDALLKDLTVVELKERERTGTGADGSKVVAHDYLILARKS